MAAMPKPKWLWPRGPYICTVEHISSARRSERGSETRMIRWRVRGTTGTGTIYSIINDTPGSSWFYRDAVEDWDHLDELMGRHFLVFVDAELDHQSTWRSRVNGILGEYVDG